MTGNEDERGPRRDRGRYKVEEDPPSSMSRRTFVKAGAAVAGVAWAGALGGSILRSVTSEGGGDAELSGKVFLYHVPEGESPWYSDMDGQEVLAEDFPVGQTAKVFVKGVKGILLRLEESKLVDRIGTDQGFVAFSSTCTHLGCQVYFVKDRTPVGDYPDGIIYCPCHQGAFDPYRAARVIYGPPPQALPIIPLKVVDGRLEAL